MSVFKASESYRPFTYTWAVEAARKHSIDMFWDVNTVDLSDDLRQYNSENGLATANVSHETNKKILDDTLCLFTEMDKVVGEGYTRLLPLIKNNEIRNMLLTFAAREVVHQRAYALAAETFGFTDGDWKRFAEYKEMRDKLDVMSDSYVTPEMRPEFQAAVIIAQILIGEGLGLYGAFANLLNQKRFGKIIGFNDINQWSLTDEQEHVTNNIRVLAEMRKDLSEVENIMLDEMILKIMDLYVEAEHRYLELVYSAGNQEDMTLGQAKAYIVYLRFLRLYQMKLVGISEVPKNPLPWMEWLVSGAKQDNFFEKKVTDYTHGLTGTIDYSKYLSLLKVPGTIISLEQDH